MTPDEFRAAAAVYRQRVDDDRRIEGEPPLPPWGYVQFWLGVPVGWALTPEPSDYKPGVISVQFTGVIFRAEGGREATGSHRWVQWKGGVQ